MCATRGQRAPRPLRATRSPSQSLIGPKRARPADFTGIVRLEQLTHPVLGLRITADQFKALDLKNNVAITASGRLSLQGRSSLYPYRSRQCDVGCPYFADLVAEADR